MIDTIDCPRCGHEHDPVGSHEDDHGERACLECGFRFHVEIDYTPSYSTSCVEHEYGEWTKVTVRGEIVDCKFCKHCGSCEIENSENVT